MSLQKNKSNIQQKDNGICEMFPIARTRKTCPRKQKKRTADREVLKQRVPKTHANMGTKFRSKNGTTWPFLQVTLTTFDKTGATFGCENGAPKNVRNRYPYLQETPQNFIAALPPNPFSLKNLRPLSLCVGVAICDPKPGEKQGGSLA